MADESTGSMEIDSQMSEAARQVLLTAHKFMRHSRRITLTEQDIQLAYSVHAGDVALGPYHKGLDPEFIRHLKHAIDLHTELPLPDTPGAFEILKSASKNVKAIKTRHQKRINDPDFADQELERLDRERAHLALGLDAPPLTFHYVDTQPISLTSILTERHSNEVHVPPALRVHWLAIDGEQPHIPENPIIVRDEVDSTPESQLSAFITTPTSTDVSISTGDDVSEEFPSTIRPRPLQSLPKELITYYNLVKTSLFPTPSEFENTRALVLDKLSRFSDADFDAYLQSRSPNLSQTSDTILPSNLQDPKEQYLLDWFESEKASRLYSLALDDINPLVPHFGRLILQQSSPTSHTSKQTQFQKLSIIIRIIRALLANKKLKLDPYLHFLVPPLLHTLLLDDIKGSTQNPRARFALRTSAADTIAYLIRTFGQSSFSSLGPRILSQYLGTLFNPQSSIQALFGALSGLSHMGTNVSDTTLCRPLKLKSPSTPNDTTTASEPNLFTLARIIAKRKPVSASFEIEIDETNKPVSNEYWDHLWWLLISIATGFLSRRLSDRNPQIQEYASQHFLPVCNEIFGFGTIQKHVQFNYGNPDQLVVQE